jgi:hypothetical protein
MPKQVLRNILQTGHLGCNEGRWPWPSMPAWRRRLKGLQLSRLKHGAESRLTDAVMASIGAHLQGLECLDVRHHCITAQGVRELESVRCLQELAATGSAKVQSAVSDVCP